jgi:hypothetical protein
MKELDHLGLSVNTVPKSGEEHVRLHSLRRDAVDAFLSEPVASSWSAEKQSDFDLASFGLCALGDSVAMRCETLVTVFIRICMKPGRHFAERYGSTTTGLGVYLQLGKPWQPK